MEIRLSTFKRLAAVLLLIGVLVGGGWYAWRYLSVQEEPEVAQTPGYTLATASVTAYLSPDVTEGRDAWIARLCNFAGGDETNGCAYAQVMAEIIWPGVQRQKARLAFDAQDAALAKDSPTIQVWRVTGIARNLNTRQEQTATYYVALERRGDAWFFNRVLMDAEAEALEVTP